VSTRETSLGEPSKRVGNTLKRRGEDFPQKGEKINEHFTGGKSPPPGKKFLGKMWPERKIKNPRNVKKKGGEKFRPVSRG